MDTMSEEIWTIENGLNTSLNITKERTDEIRDTGKLVRFGVFVVLDGRASLVISSIPVSQSVSRTRICVGGGVLSFLEPEVQIPAQNQIKFPVFLTRLPNFFDTGKQVTRFEAEKEKLTEKLTEVESTLEEMDREYKERDEEV